MDSSAKNYLNDIDQISREQNALPLYVVGGTLRDLLIGKACADYDFTGPRCIQVARAFAEKVGRTLVALDETTGHETFRVVLHHDLYFDFTTMQGNSIEEDLAQRDFTISAMAISLPDFIKDKSALIDPFKGRDDLQNKLIRVLPGSAFEDDPLRLLRAFRFAAKLGFTIEPETLRQIETHKSKVNRVAMERITYELLQFFSADRSDLRLMDQTGLLTILFPGITELKSKPGPLPGTTTWENIINGFQELEKLLLHPDTFLEKHGQLIKDYLSENNRRALLKWASLVGPMASRTTQTTGLIDFLKQFRMSNEDIKFADRALACSSTLLAESRSASTGLKEESGIYQFIKWSGDELIASILLSLAERLGNQQDIKYFIQLLNRILDFYVKTYLPAQETPPLLDGEALLTRFKLTPSPLFKTILSEVEEARVLGTIHTPEEAERLAQQIITKQ